MPARDGPIRGGAGAATVSVPPAIAAANGGGHGAMSPEWSGDDA